MTEIDSLTAASIEAVNILKTIPDTTPVTNVTVYGLNKQYHFCDIDPACRLVRLYSDSERLLYEPAYRRAIKEFKLAGFSITSEHQHLREFAEGI